jgi:DHA1 family bicyclomycin/chloramphenicol resistance-like MFS transporter
MPARSALLWLTLLLGVLIALTPLGTDSYVPALPVIAQAFIVPVSAAQLTLTSFFAGLAIGQLAWGPLSDRYGRKPVLLAALALACGAAVACALSTSIDAIIWFRLLQGIGMSGGPVIARSVVRDLYSHEHAAQLLARMTVVFSVVPIAAPLVGAQVLAWWGWQAVLGLHSTVLVALIIAVAAGLTETVPAERALVGARDIARNFASILSEPRFVAPFVAMLCAQLGIFAFVSSSAFVLVQGAGVSPSVYSRLFALVMLGQITGAWAGSRMVMRLGIGRMLRLGAVLACAAGLLAAALAWAGVVHWLAIVLPLMVYLAATALLIPSATAAALSPFPRAAGSAASLMGVTQFALGAALSSLLGELFDGTPRAMASAVALAGVGTLAAEALLVRRPGLRVDRAL